MKILKVNNVGNESCKHEWVSNPTNQMTIGRNGFLFQFDRICKHCLRREFVLDNHKSKNCNGYKELKKQLKR